MAIQENITQNQPPIDDKSVALLYEDLKDSYDVGSLEDFKAYLSDKETRDLFFEQVIKPEYDVDTIDDFESAYGFAEKKNQVDTPSSGQEEVTESITETPTELGSLDSSQENVDIPVIPLVETDGDLSEPPVEIAEEAVEVLPEQPKKISQQEKDYNDWNSLGFLTEDEKKAAQEIYLKEQQGDFGIVSNISNIIKSTPKTIYGITNNPFSNPEGVSKARSINEIEDAEIRKKRIDFLNKIDSPERRKAIEKMIKTDKWESNQERIDITKNLEGSEIVLNNLSSKADFLIKRRTELLELEITGQTTEKERLALLNEFKEIQSELSDIKKEGQKIISSYDGLAKNYEENSQDLGSFDQELELLKKDYQFFSNAMNIVSTGFEDIVDNISYQTLRAFNSQLDSSIETLKKDALFNPDDIDNELYDNMSKSNTRAGKKILDISLEKKKKREKEREFFTPSVAAEDISSVMDFVDFTIDGVLNTTPTLIQLGVPYVGQASFLLSQQASNELSIRQGIIDRESELKEINEILEDSGLSSEDLSSLTKRKKQLENQPTPSETAIFAASGAMAVSELAFAKVGKIRLLNKAKRTAQAIGKKSLVDNIKKTWGKKWAGTAFDFTKDISGEGLEEVGVNLVTNIAEMYVIGDMYNTDGTTRSILDGTFEAGLGGLSTGGVLSGTTKVAGIAANSISDRKRRKQVLGNVLQINNYLKELDNSNISVELKDIISEQIKELNKKNGEIINATLQTYDELSPEDRKEVGRIDGEFNAKSVALTELLKKENRNEELVKSLQNQLDALDSKKASILDNKTKDTPREFTNEAVSSLKEEGIDDPTLNQVLDKMEQLTKQKEDAISKPSTKEQVLPDASTSTEGGKDSEVELQQVGEGDVEQVTPDTQVQEGETQTDKPSDTTTEGDVEQVTQPTSTEEGMSVNRDRYQVPGSRTIDVEVDESGKPTVVNRKTGKKVDRVPAKAQDFILTNVVDVNEGSKAKIPEGANPEQVVNEIAENSNNIKEVSEAINQLRTESENTQESKDIGGELGGLVNQKTKRPAIKFTAKSWKRVTGLSPKESGVSNSWIATEANGGVSIEDGFLDIVSLPGELPVDTNQRISSDQVVEFIKQYPNATALKEASTSTQLTDLEIKFEQLTGLKATPRNIETVVGIDPNREPIALTKERSKESTTKESAEKESEGVSKLRDALRKSGTTVKRNTAEQISKLGKQIENAKKALSKILPDVEIIMPSSEAEYKRLTGESNTDNSGGTYIDGKIYINPNRASSRVVSHEVFHAVLLSKGMSEAQAKAITERMLSAVKKSASKELLDKIDKFSKRYPEALQSEESIAELVGILASEYDTLPKPSQNIVKKWLDKLAKIFGLKPFTDVEVVDLLNTLASKVESGQEVSAKDVKILDGKDSKQKTEARKSSSKPTIEEIVTKGKEIGSSDADIREVAQQEGYANKDTNSEIEKYDTKKREAAQKAEKLFVKGGKIAKSLDFLRRWALSARGFLPKSMQIGKEVLTGAVAANAKQAENNLKDLQRYINKQKKSVQDKLVQDLNSYMRGDADIDTLPAKLRPIAYAMRNHIDSLSMSLVESGAITDIKFEELSPKQKKELIKEFGTEAEARKNYKSQKDNIIDNLGSYLNRSFEVFDNKDYSPSDAVLNAAKEKLREQYMEAAKEKAVEENNDVDAVLEEMVDNALKKILSREEGREFLNSSKLGSKNISVLKEKIDIPAEIRALMGEYTDPALNYVRSVNKIAALVANQEFLSEMKKAGEGVFFFNKPTGEYNVLIAPKGSKTYNPLNGMYTSKAIRDAVLNIPGAKINDKTISAGLSFIYKAVGAVKYGKTILSPATHAKNIIGNLFFMAYNGYANPKEYFDAANVVISDLKGNFITRKIFKKNKTENRKKMQEYIKLGIINQSSNLGEIRSLLQSEGSLENLMSKRNQGDKTPLKRLKRFFKRSGKVAESAYQAEDDVFKIISFEMEKKRYSKALFNKTFDKLSPEQQKEVTEKVTEIVKNILPNYSRIGNIGKFMKAVPIFGTFISFQIEAMRTAYNVAQLALSEIQNKKTAAIGAKRIAGISSVIGVKAAILPMFGVAGQKLTEAVKSALGDEDEDEEVEKEGDVITESARQFLPKWAENSSVIITKLDNGKFDYINFSASDPHSFIDQAIISAFRGETAAEGMGNALNSLIEPFVTFDILFKAVTSIETDYGKQIYNETDTPNEVAEKFGAIVYKTFEPGGVTSARKLLKAYEDKDKSLKNEIIGQLTGFKVHTVDF